MKLHLPKSLLTALLATFTVVTTFSTTAWAGAWYSDGRCGSYVLYYDDDVAVVKIDTLTLPTASAPSNGQDKDYSEVFICSGYNKEGQTTTIGKVIAADGAIFTLTANPWENHKYYEAFVIEELEFGGGTGSGSFNITNSFNGWDATSGVVQNAIINKVSGTLSSVNNAGNLTLGSVQLGGNITNSGVLNIAGTLTGSGAINNNGEGAKLTVDVSRGYSAFDGVVYTYANGNATGKSGFVKGEQTFRVLAETISYSGDVYVAGSETPTSLSGGSVTIDAGDSFVFHVDDVWTYNADQSNGATSFQVSEAGTLNFAGSTASGGLTINSEGTVALTAETTLTGTVTVNGGTFTTGSKKLNGDKLVLNGVSSATISGDRTLSANLELNNTYLTIGEGDTFDYDDDSALTFKIGSGATLDVQGNRQSVRSNHIIEMAGGTLKGAGNVSGNYTYGIDFYAGGKFNVTADSRIETNVGGHNSGGGIEFAVAAQKTLTMTGSLVGLGTFSKTEGGTMIYSGAAFNQALTISDGVFEYNFTGERTHTGSISGDGTLRKSGEGTLTLSSANTTVTNLAVTGGKLVYNVEEEKTHTLSGTAGTFEKNGVGTLNLGALKGYSYTGGLTVNEGKVVFTGTTDSDSSAEDANNPPSFVKLVNGLTTVGDAQVEIAGNVIFNYTAEKSTEVSENVITIDDNIHITGNLEINSWGTSEAPDGDNLRRWNVNEGGNLSVDGHLWLTNKQKMVVNGGNVAAAGGIKLGHSVNGTGSWDNHSIYSKLVIEDGNVTTSGLTFYGGNNEVLMSGGELAFTPTATEDNPTPNVLSGGGTETYKNKFTVTGGTLKATDTGWALEGTSTHVVSLGNATFDIAEDKAITLSGTMALTGVLDVVGKGALQLGTIAWNVQSSDLANFVVMGGVVSDSTKENGLGYSDYVFIRGNVEQQAETSTTILVDNAAATINKHEDGYWSFAGTAVDAYVIGGQFTTEAAAADADAVGANVFVVNKTGVFTIADDITGGKTAKELVRTTLGSGAMKLGTNVALSHSGEGVQFAGSLDIESGATLTLGRVYDTGTDSTSSNTTEYDIDLSTLSALNLNGGTLKMYYVAPHIKSMTVEKESTIYIDDVWADKQTAKADATRIDSLQLDANLSMETNWKSNVNIGVLSGGANLTVKQTQTDESKMSNLWIDSVNDYTGDISLTGKVALTLNIGAEESLNVAQLSKDSSSSSITITGSGLLDLGDATTTFNTSVAQQKVNQSGVFSLGDSSNWTGTVRIQNATHNTNQLGLNLNNLSNENSAVELINVNGWFTDTMVGKLILTADEAKNAAWTIVNGGSTTSNIDNTMATFNGAVSGDGVMKYAWSVSHDNVDTYTGFTFKGDISGWNGAFVMDVSNSLTNFNYVLGGSAAVVNAAIGKAEKNKGKLHLKVNRDTTTTFNNTVKVDTLTTTGDGAVHFNKDVTVEDTVTAGGTLHVEDGTFVVQGTLNAADKSVELSGSYSNNVGTVGKSTAKLRLEGEENQVGTFDFGRNGFARGTLELGAESDTTAGALYMNKDVTISMEKGAQLTVGTSTAATDTAAAINALTSMTAASDKAGISIDDDSTDANTRGQFTHANNTKYVLTDMDVAVNYSSALTSKYRYDNSSVSNVGSAKLTLDNAANELTGLKAELGSIDVLNKESLSLQELKVATSLTVGAYTAGTDSAKAGITVMECVEFGASATLNANLTVATGSTVKLDGYGDTAAMVAGSLTLHTGLILDGSVLGSLEALDAGDSLAIFKEVSALVFGGNAAEAAVMTLSESTLQEVDASVYFTNLAEGDYLLVYNGADGVVSIQATVPEPTTATLSLLALAALAARRRRRK